MHVNLTPTQIKAATLRCEGLSRREIAKRLGVTAQAVKKLFARARARNRVAA